jgi:signal transduction histidine kinase
VLYPELRALSPDSTLADLPAAGCRIGATMLGSTVAGMLEAQPELPGVIVDVDGAAPAVISRATFYQHMSRGFSREIYLRRPIAVMVQTLAPTSLQLAASCPIHVAAARALERPPQLVYEPILVGDSGAELRLLDAHVLLLAQTQLLTLANRIIVEQKEAAEDANRVLRETQAALIQKEKLASLGQLAAGLAHELNNPVAFVANNLAVLQGEIADLFRLLDAHAGARAVQAAADPAAAAALTQLEEEIDLNYTRTSFGRQIQSSTDGLMRVRDVVRNLCDFARLDRAEWAEVDLNGCLRSTVDILAYELKRREIRLETRWAALQPVFVQPGKINQVFLNLLLNAIHACAPGGAVAVRTRQEARGVCAEIEDNGCGIRAEHLPRLFEPFFTTRPVGQGMGLGLSISYGIVRDHGGAIEVQSQVGQGSLFRVWLPLQPPGGGVDERPVRLRATQKV